MYSMERELLVNAMQTPDGTVLTSVHCHNFVSHVDNNGETYINDGGTEYIRRSVNKEPAIDKCLYTDSPFEEIRESLIRVTTNGEQIPLKDMSIEHLYNCIIYNAKENDTIDKFKWQYIRELAYRYNNNLF